MPDRRDTSAARQRALKAMARGTPDAANSLMVTDKGPCLKLPLEGTTDCEILYLGVLIHVPNLLEPFAHAIALNCITRPLNSKASRKSLYDLLCAGLVAFLRETARAQYRLKDLDQRTLHAFIFWLNRTHEGVAVLRRRTRIEYYNSALRMMRLLRTEQRYAADLIPSEEIPPSPWPKNIESTPDPGKALSEVQLKRLFLAAAAAVRETSAAVTRDLNLIDGQDVSDPELAKRQAALKKLAEHFSRGTRSWHQLQRADSRLLKQVRELGRENMLRPIRPSMADIVPFMILFAIIFRLNDSVLLGCQRSDFAARRWIGGERIFARPWKPRAGRRQIASTSAATDAINPKPMLALLERWTRRLRELAPGDELFLYWSTGKRNAGAHGINARKDPGITHIVRRAIQSFANDAGVDADVTITRIRDAVLELAHHRSGGNILLVKAAGSHKSADTTADHYINAAGRAREDEALAGAMRLQAMMVANQGRFDPRRENDDQNLACTPGWSCSRSVEPPPVGDRADGQCMAYGRCPVCRHGSIDFASPRACAQTHLLVEAIERAADRIEPESWLARLAPIRMHLLENVLPRFSRQTHERASRLSLPPLSVPE